MRNIRGNSTIPCPIAMSNPALLLFAAFSNVATNNGPGSKTPDKDIRTTENKKN